MLSIRKQIHRSVPLHIIQTFKITPCVRGFDKSKPFISVDPLFKLYVQKSIQCSCISTPKLQLICTYKPSK